MRDVPDLFRDGLGDYFAGRDTDEGEAAGSLLAEILIMHRQWLNTQPRKR